MDGWKVKRKERKLTLIFKRFGLRPAQSECFCCLCWGLWSDYTEKKTQREKIIHIKLEASHLLLFLISLHPPPLLFLSHLDYQHQKPEPYACLGLHGSVLDWTDITLRRNGQDSNSMSLATVGTGIYISRRKLTKEQRSQSRPEAESARTAQCTKLQSRVTCAANSSNDRRLQPSRPAHQMAYYWGQPLSRGTDHAHSWWIQWSWTHLAENIRPWNNCWWKHTVLWRIRHLH